MRGGSHRIEVIARSMQAFSSTAGSRIGGAIPPALMKKDAADRKEIELIHVPWIFRCPNFCWAISNSDSLAFLFGVRNPETNKKETPGVSRGQCGRWQSGQGNFITFGRPCDLLPLLHGISDLSKILFVEWMWKNNENWLRRL